MPGQQVGQRSFARAYISFYGNEMVVDGYKVLLEVWFRIQNTEYRIQNTVVKVL